MKVIRIQFNFFINFIIALNNLVASNISDNSRRNLRTRFARISNLQTDNPIFLYTPLTINELNSIPENNELVDDNLNLLNVNNDYENNENMDIDLNNVIDYLENLRE